MRRSRDALGHWKWSAAAAGWRRLSGIQNRRLASDVGNDIIAQVGLDFNLLHDFARLGRRLERDRNDLPIACRFRKFAGEAIVGFNSKHFKGTLAADQNILLLLYARQQR